MQKHQPKSSLRAGRQQIGHELTSSSLFRGGARLRLDPSYAANKYQIPFTETSAKTSQNVNDLFTSLTKQMLKLNEGTKSNQRLRPPLPIKPAQEE